MDSTRRVCRVSSSPAHKAAPGALVELAEKGEYHTVVIGRKGVSSLDEFLIGRVSRKILYVGRKHHVWIVD